MRSKSCCFISLGGDEEIRTLDFLHAKQALSQLSYAPTTNAIIPHWGRFFNNNFYNFYFIYNHDFVALI